MKLIKTLGAGLISIFLVSCATTNQIQKPPAIPIIKIEECDINKYCLTEDGLKKLNKYILRLERGYEEEGI